MSASPPISKREREKADEKEEDAGAAAEEVIERHIEEAEEDLTLVDAALVSFEAKLEFTSQTMKFKREGLNGVFMHLGAEEWKAAWPEGVQSNSYTWHKTCRSLEKWARDSFPELSVQLAKDEEGWYLAVSE
jgi:hypothetical protein